MIKDLFLFLVIRKKLGKGERWEFGIYILERNLYIGIYDYVDRNN